MAKAMIGAKVRYCGHRGYFIADIFRVGNSNVVRANGPVTMDNLIREDVFTESTHWLHDYPVAGFWRPDLGVYVVPETQVETL